MIVVSNTSPILNLAVIKRLDLLQRLYNRVFIPETVWQELLTIRTGQPMLQDIQTLSWIEKRSVTNQSLVDSLLLELDAGEAEAIALATDLKSDLLLLDERSGRNTASRLGMRFIGLLGMLVEAKGKGFINKVKPILDELMIEAGFWISSRLYARIL